MSDAITMLTELHRLSLDSTWVRRCVNDNSFSDSVCVLVDTVRDQVFKSQFTRTPTELTTDLIITDMALSTSSRLVRSNVKWRDGLLESGMTK
jgi:hypothetical protein